MPFRRRYKNRDTTDNEGGGGSRGPPPGWRPGRGWAGGPKDLVDFLRDFREWRAQKYDRADNREYRQRWLFVGNSILQKLPRILNHIEFYRETRIIGPNTKKFLYCNFDKHHYLQFSRGGYSLFGLV